MVAGGCVAERAYGVQFGCPIPSSAGGRPSVLGCYFLRCGKGRGHRRYERTTHRENIGAELVLFLFTDDPMQRFEMPREWFYPTPSCVVRVPILNIGENAKAESEDPSDGQGYRRRWGQYVTRSTIKAQPVQSEAPLHVDTNHSNLKLRSKEEVNFGLLWSLPKGDGGLVIAEQGLLPQFRVPSQKFSILPEDSTL